MSRARGFTLVEVLVALVVTAIVLIVVANGMQASDRRQALVRERDAAAALASDIVEGWLASGGQIEVSGTAGKLAVSVEQQTIFEDEITGARLNELSVTIATPSGRRLATLTRRHLFDGKVDQDAR
ncbi:prepilin-type N-terminal cleavage/methylation domain-containing protein [Sphingomicrobium arenosum]|uniref:prepilin-type N-terminal cleavage/methylation domain-containing protein n=1 Tax=Sphingomicrobium arenosum TaxID=2233861 RepID=UPI002240EBDA|nr:prepilin-type N-terminal cleavage/methylation domain-containing protein [Sphingomicrobium arenosum]